MILPSTLVLSGKGQTKRIAFSPEFVSDGDSKKCSNLDANLFKLEATETLSWRTNIGATLISLFGYESTTKGKDRVEYVLSGFPAGYEMFYSRSEREFNRKERFDYYIYGGSNRYRSGKDFAQHLFWLSNGGGNQCECKPCSSKGATTSSSKQKNPARKEKKVRRRARRDTSLSSSDNSDWEASDDTTVTTERQQKRRRTSGSGSGSVVGNIEYAYSAAVRALDLLHPSLPRIDELVWFQLADHLLLNEDSITHWPARIISRSILPDALEDEEDQRASSQEYYRAKGKQREAGTAEETEKPAKTGIRFEIELLLISGAPRMDVPLRWITPYAAYKPRSVDQLREKYGRATKAFLKEGSMVCETLRKGKLWESIGATFLVAYDMAECVATSEIRGPFEVVATASGSQRRQNYSYPYIMLGVETLFPGDLAHVNPTFVLSSNDDHSRLIEIPGKDKGKELAIVMKIESFLRVDGKKLFAVGLIFELRFGKGNGMMVQPSTPFPEAEFHLLAPSASQNLTSEESPLMFKLPISMLGTRYYPIGEEIETLAMIEEAASEKYEGIKSVDGWKCVLGGYGRQVIRPQTTHQVKNRQDQLASAQAQVFNDTRKRLG